MRPEVLCLTNGAFAENCYVVADRAAGDAVLVDPGEEADLFLARLRTERLTLRAVWLTHAHLDHVAGVAAIKEATGVPIWLHADDRPLYDAAPQQARVLLGLDLPALPPPDRAIVPGEPLRVGAVEFEVRHVPGHSPGSVALVGDGVALVGDAVFAGSVGRTDLPGGDSETLLTSIRDQLLTLPDETVLYPGHGPETTVGRERRTNPFLTGAYRLV
ncbi:MAG: MBL fold metallo-hydrolase [Gemmatimonadota bacterium]|nr:MBL fold metallo-hydrolase [Gemmatimonadota bacterium]